MLVLHACSSEDPCPHHAGTSARICPKSRTQCGTLLLIFNCYLDPLTS